MNLRDRTDPVYLYFEQLKSERSKKTAYRALCRFSAWFATDAKPEDVNWSLVDYGVVEDYKHHLREAQSKRNKNQSVNVGLAPSTRNLYLNCLRGVLSKAAKMDGVAPEKRVSLRAYEQIMESRGESGSRTRDVTKISPAQFRKILKNINPDSINAQRDQAILSTLMHCGLRVSELTALAYPHDVDFKKRKLRVVGKGNKERYVPLNPVITSILRDYIKVRGRKHSFLFMPTNRTGTENYAKSMSTNTVRKLIKKHTSKVIKGVRPHDFRHACATLLSKSGAYVITIKNILGHQNIETTNRYISTDEESARQGLNKMGRLIGL